MHVRASAISAYAMALFALAVFAVSPDAQAQEKSLKDRLHGAWHLVSVTVGEAEPYGKNPQGLMYIGADGEFSIVAIGEGTTQKIAYFGTYIVDEAGNSITFHITATTSPTGAGADYKWIVTSNGGEMIQHRATPSGEKGSIALVWRRES